MIRLALSIVLLLLFAPSPVSAQTFGGALDGKAKDIKPQDVIQWDAFQASPDPLGVTVGVRMTSKDDWTIYAKNLSFSGPAGYTIAKIEPPKALRQRDPMGDEEVDVYAGGEFTITFAGPSEWQGATFPLNVKYVGCTKVICLFPYTQVVEVPFVGAGAKKSEAPITLPTPVVAPLPAGERAQIGPATCDTAAVASGGDDDLDLEGRLAKLLGGGGVSYGMLLLLVLAGGLISNLTPCVYPMIPITLRLLARQGSSPLMSSLYYALGIVATYSSLAIVAAASGGMFGKLLASTAFNLVFALIMAVLGISMLGFGDFSKLQALGSRLGSGAPSPRNTFLMGAGAGLVAAPCTGPILAALLAYTARGEHGMGASTMLMVTYSLGFALPYIFLGGAAAKVSAVKVPPAVQVGTKILFASVMLGLSLYYLRIPLYDAVVAMRGKWQPVALIFSGAGLALLVVWTLSTRLSNNKLSMILPTATLAIGIFGGSQWATSNAAPAEAGAAQLAWIKSEELGFAAAKTNGRPILIDFWAEWCEACKKMDGSTFSEAPVIAALTKGWTTIKLDLTESSEANDAIQQKYALPSLPTLVLLPPDGNLTKMQMISGFVNGSTLLGHLSRFCQAAAE
jgi:thiol:disulfide interchange protein DsbD